VVFEVERTERELPFVNTTKQFHSGDRNCRAGEVLEPKHRARSLLDAAMILFNQIIQILRRAQSRASWKQTVDFQFAHRAMRSGVAVQSKGLRRSTLMSNCFLKESLSCCHVPSFTEPKVNGLAVLSMARYR